MALLLGIAGGTRVTQVWPVEAASGQLLLSAGTYPFFFAQRFGLLPRAPPPQPWGWQGRERGGVALSTDGRHEGIEGGDRRQQALVGTARGRFLAWRAMFSSAHRRSATIPAHGVASSKRISFDRAVELPQLEAGSDMNCPALRPATCPLSIGTEIRRSIALRRTRRVSSPPTNAMFSVSSAALRKLSLALSTMSPNN